MDTDSIRIWIYFALGLGIAELFFNRLFLICGALACLITPLLSSALEMTGGAAPSPVLIVAVTFFGSYLVLALGLSIVRNRDDSPRQGNDSQGERFVLGPTVPGQKGPEFILRIGKRVYIVSAPGEVLGKGDTVEITGMGDEIVTVKPVARAEPAPSLNFSNGGAFQPYPRKPQQEQLETMEIAEQEPQSEEKSPEPDAPDELSPLLDSISRAVNDDPDPAEADESSEQSP